MAERRRRNEKSHEQADDQPALKKLAATNPASSHSQPHHHLPRLSRRRPLCAGRFAGSYFNSPISSTQSAASAFSPGLFARTVVRLYYKESQLHAPPAAAGLRSSERTPRIGEEITKQKIGIIGAGMAGLYAALILDSLGFDNYEILEANPDRVGGRVFTQYFDVGHSAGTGLSAAHEKWNYIDYGAMRFPSIPIMDRIIGEHHWSLVNYLNSLTEGEHLKIKLLDYHLSVPNNIHYYNSTRKTNADLEKEELDPLHFGKSRGGGLPDKYVQEPYTTWLDPAFSSFVEELHKGFDTGFRALLEQDYHSVRSYLRTFSAGPDKTKYPQELIDYLETLDSATGQYDNAFSEAVLDSFSFSTESDKWKCVEGGASRLADAMRRVIKSKPEMKKRVTKIAPSSKLPKGTSDIDVFVAGESEARTYYHVINTVPPAVLRTLDTTECKFSYGKRTALRVLHVDSSLKIGLLFKSRWWQDETVMNGKPMKGGQSSTDLPIRTIVYPSYGIDDADAAGVLIASYPWAQDAERISALAAAQPRQMVELAISNIATVHGLSLKFLQEQYTGQYYIQDWDLDEYSQGAFALFGPGQFVSTFPRLIAPEMEGRYHTAGEMASVHHAWIVGALNSAWRCVHEILMASGATQKIQELKQKWDEIDEVDMDYPY